MSVCVGDDLDAVDEAAIDRLQLLGDAKRDLALAVENDEAGWERCACGLRTPNCYCPCGARLRPPASSGEIRWMRNHGFEPSARDTARCEPVELRRAA